jgi:hypothetical protein
MRKIGLAELDNKGAPRVRLQVEIKNFSLMKNQLTDTKCTQNENKKT